MWEKAEEKERDRAGTEREGQSGDRHRERETETETQRGDTERGHRGGQRERTDRDTEKEDIN